MKRFNKFNDEASYSSFIKYLAEPGHYTSYIDGLVVKKGDSIYTDGTNYYNYQEENTTLIGTYAGQIGDKHYIQNSQSIYTGNFQSLHGFNSTMPYPENIGNYNSYKNTPKNVKATVGPVEIYTENYGPAYRLIDKSSNISTGGAVDTWTGWNFNYNKVDGVIYAVNRSGEWYQYSYGYGPDFYHEVYEFEYPESYWNTESNYRAWGIEALLSYRKTTGLDWELPSNLLDLGNNLFYYETAANNSGVTLIPVLAVSEIKMKVSPCHYDYVKEMLHIYSDITIAFEQLNDNFVDIVVISTTTGNNEVYFKFFDDIPTLMRLPSNGFTNTFKVSHYADYREILKSSSYFWYSPVYDSNYASSKDFYISYYGGGSSSADYIKFRLYRTCINGDYIEDSNIRVN